MSIENSFHQCNCTKNLEKIHNERISFKRLVCTELYTIMNMIFTMESLCGDYFNQQSQMDDNLKENLDIQFATPNIA